MGRRFALASLFALLASCSTHPPARWAQGGTQVSLGRARWERPREMVDLLPDGRVLIDGDEVFTVDGAGRVSNVDHEPYAVLEPGGSLIGRDEAALGQIGAANTSPPWSPEAWLTVGSDGRVTYYESDGDRIDGGKWVGCEGPVARTCTLVSHLVTLRDHQRRPKGRFSVGVGVGVGR